MKLKQTLKFLFSIMIVIFALYSLSNELRTISYSSFLVYLKSFPLQLVFLALGLTCLSYLLLSSYEWMGLKYLDKTVETKKVVKVSFLTNAFINNIGSSIVAGPVLRHRFYTAGLGLNALEAVQLVLFIKIGVMIGLSGLAGSCFLIAPAQLGSEIALHIPSLHTLGFLFLSLPVLYLSGCLLRFKPLTWRDWNIQFPTFRTGSLQFLFSALDWFLAALIFYVLLGSTKCPLVCVVGIFLLAQAVGLLSQVPAGIGVFEGVMVAGLSPWIPGSETLAAILMFRVIYYLVPLFLAGVLLVKTSWGQIGKVATETHKNFKELSIQIMPHFMALITFIAGGMLLLSGSLPAMPERLKIVREFIPLDTVEISHFLGSVIGLFLLLLTRGIQNRINVSYYACLLLFGAGAIFSLLKGFQYEEAIMLMFIFILFLPCRGLFYKKSRLTEDVFTPAWSVAIVVVLLCVISLGLFSYKHIQYSDQLWWTFAWSSDSTRFMRAMLIVTILFALTAFSKLFSASRKSVLQVDELDLDKVMPILKASLNPIANLSLLGDKKFIFSQSGKSFLMYGVEAKTCVVLGDPIGLEEEWDELTRSFVNLCERHDLRPVFYEIDSSNAHHYLDHGFHLLKLGEEAKVDVQTFTLQGGGKVAELRHACTRAEKNGFTFEVCPKEKTHEIMLRLKIISDAWIREKSTKEKSFSLGFFDEVYLKNFAIAIIKKGDDIVAFANIWANDDKAEYSIDLMRFIRDEAPKGVMDYLFCQMIFWGKQEGSQYFNIGMAPLAGLDESSHITLWHRIGDFIFKNGEYFYNFEGLHSYKEKYGPIWNSRYLACKNPLTIPYILKDIASLSSGGLKGIFLK